MKLLAINGSPKPQGNTYHALKIIANEIGNENIETEIVSVGNKNFRGCIGCNQCYKNRNEECALADDGVNEIVQKMKEADAIVLGSPVHFSAIGSNLKACLDRVFYVMGANENLVRHKVGASVVAVRRSGGLSTFHELNNYLTYSEMIVATSNYWNVIHGHTPGEVMKDEEGVQIMRVLAKNIAYILNLKKEANKVQAPEKENKILTNFVRG
jgi:multimeric flavodoxin WrbA